MTSHASSKRSRLFSPFLPTTRCAAQLPRRDCDGEGDGLTPSGDGVTPSLFGRKWGSHLRSSVCGGAPTPSTELNKKEMTPRSQRKSKSEGVTPRAGGRMTPRAGGRSGATSSVFSYGRALLWNPWSIIVENGGVRCLRQPAAAKSDGNCWRLAVRSVARVHVSTRRPRIRKSTGRQKRSDSHRGE